MYKNKKAKEVASRFTATKTWVVWVEVVETEIIELYRAHVLKVWCTLINYLVFVLQYKQ